MSNNKLKTAVLVLWNTDYNLCAVGLYFGPALALRASVIMFQNIWVFVGVFGLRCNDPVNKSRG